MFTFFLERVFEFRVLGQGLKWKYRKMLLKESKRKKIWEPFVLPRFKKVNGTITSFQNMVPGVLYRPKDSTFPLVDMYYKDSSEKLYGIQATMAKKHAKNVTVYQEFYDEIGTDPITTPLMLYYLIMPCNIEHFSQATFSEGKFFLDVKSRKSASWMKKISFFAIVPPDDFGAEF